MSQQEQAPGFDDAIRNSPYGGRGGNAPRPDSPNYSGGGPWSETDPGTEDDVSIGLPPQQLPLPNYGGEWGTGSGDQEQNGGNGGGSPTTPTTPAPGGGTTEQNDAFAYISELLTQYGLGSLASWAWDQIVNGHSSEQVVQSLRQQPEYAQRFPAMALRRAAGLNAISEGEYVSYERQAQQLMRAAGMPPGFWDQPEDFARLIGNDVSVNELNQRITNAYIRVAQAPTEVRDAFSEFFGVDGDVAFAAYFLDPDRAAPLLDKAVTEAEIAGTGRRFGVGIGQDMAGRLAEIGINLGSSQQGFAQLAGQSALFRESVSERDDLRIEREGVAAAFGTDAEAAGKVARRKEERQAAFSGSNQQAGATQRGLSGVGSASGY